MELDDAQLVARSQDGDLVAFNGIVECYQTQIYNMAARVLGNRTSAEDVAQETFASAYKTIGRFRGGSLRAWLLRIASNLSIDSIRTSRRRPEASLDEALLSPCGSSRRLPAGWPGETGAGRSRLVSVGHRAQMEQTPDALRLYI